MGQWYSGLEKWRLFWQDVRRDLARFPWRNTALTLRERFREDRLGETASSLTFTTVMALVPLFTVALAIFSALTRLCQPRNERRKLVDPKSGPQ